MENNSIRRDYAKEYIKLYTDQIRKAQLKITEAQRIINEETKNMEIARISLKEHNDTIELAHSLIGKPYNSNNWIGSYDEITHEDNNLTVVVNATNAKSGKKTRMPFHYMVAIQQYKKNLK
jgi:hypothetical protein